MANPAQATTAHDGGTRRDFLYLAAGAFGALGTAVTIWPFISSLNPSADVLALASTDVNLQPIAAGQAILVTWRGKPVFVRRRTQQEIDAARQVALSDLRDPQTDQARAQRPEWLILVGV